jgi:ribonuclease R
MNIKEIILNFMREQAYKPMNIQELGKVFGISNVILMSLRIY